MHKFEDLCKDDYDENANGMIEYGVGIRIHKTANIYPSALIGENVVIGAYSEIGKDVQIGDGARIGFGVFIPENVMIGENVFVGPRVCFTNDKYPPSLGAWREQPPTKVGDNAAIGANATILPNLTLNTYCKIGAGAVVTKDVPADEVWVGNPARKIGE